MTSSNIEADRPVVREKVLITVKTYPTLSSSYGELVCTAGLREDGSWIRLYPIPFRLLNDESKFKKYQWIELDVVKRRAHKDRRKESFSPVNWDDMRPGKFLKPHDYQRHEIIHRSKIFASMRELTEVERNDCLSLATFQPTSVKGMIVKPDKREWDENRFQRARAALKQGSLFDSESEAEFKRTFELAQKIPYRFIYVFKDENEKEHKLSVIDWEIGILYLNLISGGCDEKTALRKVVDKYQSFIDAPELLFFLGTTASHHNWAKNPFTIIGVYRQSPNMKAPTAHKQTSFFDA